MKSTMLCLSAAVFILLQPWKAFSYDTSSGSAPATTNAELPRVLRIGDHGHGPRSGPEASGHAPAVIELLRGKATVQSVEDNGLHTDKAMRHLDEWLGSEPWDVIHFSFGLHDLKRAEGGQPQVPSERFGENLRAIVERLKATGTALVWASITPIPDGVPNRTQADALHYNAIAQALMEEKGIPVNDLYGAALRHLDQWQVPGSVHFTQDGASELAKLVVAAVDAALAGREMPSRPVSAQSGLRAFSCLGDFLGPPIATPMQQLWEGRGGTSIVTAQDGTVIAFQAFGSNKIRRSKDGGLSWDAEIEIGAGATYGNAVVDESNGNILYVNPGAGFQWRSCDNGAMWERQEIAHVRPDGFGLIPSSVSSMQPGITLQFGKHRGRLLMPARVQGPEASNSVEWRPYHYSTALFSDDGGSTWQTSHPFPVMGTGEAALAELSDGRIMYNSREHMSRGSRFIARSQDGGETWINAYRSPTLPDGPRGSSYGCMGGMIRLPIRGMDILVYSNLDTGAGEMPNKVGASITKGRERMTVWASLDGGETWPFKRLVYDGPSAYSNLAAGRPGTPSQGRIYLLFEGGPEGHNSAVQVVSFNLSWLLFGNDADEVSGQVH